MKSKKTLARDALNDAVNGAIKAKDSSGLFEIGAKVTLGPDSLDAPEARAGCLRPGDLGEIVKMIGSGAETVLTVAPISFLMVRD